MSYIQNRISSVIPIGGVATLTGDSGGAVSPTSGNINILGAGGITVAGNPGTSTLTITGGGSGGLTWNAVAGTSQAMAVNNGYIPNNAALTTLTLPATAAVGDVVRVAGKGTGLWTIAQNAGQLIHFGSITSTLGVTGSLSAILRYDCVELLCVTANNEWVVVSQSRSRMLK